MKRRVLKAARQQQDTKPLATGSVGVLGYCVLASLFVLVAFGFWWVAEPNYADQARDERLDIKLMEATTDEQLNDLKAMLEKRIAEGNPDGQTYYLLGDLHRRQGRYADARVKFTQAFEANYAPFQSQMAIAETAIAEQQGELNDVARVALARAAELNGEDTRLQFYRGAILAQDGKLDEALSLWQTLRAKSTDGDLNQQLDANISAVKKGLALREQPGPSAEDIANAQEMEEGDRQAMIQGMVGRLAEKLKEDPSDIDGWMRLIRSYLVLGQQKEAEEAIHSLLAQKEDHPMGLFLLGRMYEERGELAEAKAVWEKVLKQIPEDRSEHQTLKKQIEALGL